MYVNVRKDKYSKEKKRDYKWLRIIHVQLYMYMMSCVIYLSYLFVLQFNERTPHPVWEERLRQNRAKHTDVTAALSMPVAADFCKAVARTEHVIR